MNYDFEDLGLGDASWDWGFKLVLIDSRGDTNATSGPTTNGPIAMTRSKRSHVDFPGVA